MTWTTRAWAALLFVAFFGFPPHPATATEAFSGARDLMGWCANMERDDIHWGLCVGSVTAAHDIIMTYQAQDDMEQLVCTTDETTRGDVVGAVIEYIHEHPEELDFSLGDVVATALIDKFPCH